MQPAVQSRYLLCSHDADLQLRRTQIDFVGPDSIWTHLTPWQAQRPVGPGQKTQSQSEALNVVSQMAVTGQRKFTAKARPSS